MTQDSPKTDKPVPQPEEVAKTDKDNTIPDQELEKVVGGNLQMGLRGSNDRS